MFLIVHASKILIVNASNKYYENVISLFRLSTIYFLILFNPINH